MAKLECFALNNTDVIQYLIDEASLVPTATEAQRINHGRMFVEILGSGDALDVDTMLALERMGWMPSYMLFCMELYENAGNE